MSRGNRMPGDNLTDMLRDISNGVEIVEIDSDPNDLEAPVEQLHEAKPAYVIPSPAPSRPDVDIPIEILDVLKSPERQELIEVAALLRRSHEHTRVMLFMTPIGDIRVTVNWMSCKPSDINPDGMFFVKTRANSLAFIPKPGAVFDVAFEGVKGQVSVVCLAAPQRLYPSVDLLCFMPHTPFMEKTGQLNEGAPSVVSGRPSTVVVDGEPVAEGEEPMRKSAFAATSKFADFDQVRPS